eukprot:5017627-Amphidinium_carterae.2
MPVVAPGSLLCNDERRVGLLACHTSLGNTLKEQSPKEKQETQMSPPPLHIPATVAAPRGLKVWMRCGVQVFYVCSVQSEGLRAHTCNPRKVCSKRRGQNHVTLLLLCGGAVEHIGEAAQGRDNETALTS